MGGRGQSLFSELEWTTEARYGICRVPTVYMGQQTVWLMCRSVLHMCTVLSTGLKWVLIIVDQFGGHYVADQQTVWLMCRNDHQTGPQ